MANRARIVEETGEIEIVIRYKPAEGASMLELEEQLLGELNDIGSQATGVLLEKFDTDGSPLVVGNMKYTSKGRQNKAYQTPYGEVGVERHVYQNMYGGRTYCPLERDARIVGTGTPKFAAMAAWKYATMSAGQAREDLRLNHGRDITRSFLQDNAKGVAAAAREKEEVWTYEEPVGPGDVHTVSLGVDGTTLLYCEDGYRLAMVGTLALYDAEGKRLHTIYVGAEPEYGKAAFFRRMDGEVERLKRKYPGARWVGIADGAADNWTWLERHTGRQILDFYHASGYLETAAAGVCRPLAGREGWCQTRRHSLRHEHGAAEEILGEMQGALGARKLGAKVEKDLTSAITYFENHLHQMDYHRYSLLGYPIGSGVTEAGCKTLVKQRMCCSGMKWRPDGASDVLTLRSLVLTPGRWEQFWRKIARYGI